MTSDKDMKFFGRRAYSYLITVKTKKEAREIAKGQRMDGKWARIIDSEKLKGHYDVYSRWSDKGWVNRGKP